LISTPGNLKSSGFDTLTWSTNMLNKIWLAFAALSMTFGPVLAQVDVNKADMAALDGIRGVGPTTSKAILAERRKGGDFRDWNDLEQRVKGISAKRSRGLSEAGLTVNGQPKSRAAAAAPDAQTRTSVSD
jgi:competence protein ComEA